MLSAGYSVTAIDISRKWSVGRSVGRMRPGPHRRRSTESISAGRSRRGPSVPSSQFRSAQLRGQPGPNRAPDPASCGLAACSWHQSSDASAVGLYLSRKRCARAVAFSSGGRACPAERRYGVDPLLHARAVRAGVRPLGIHTTRTAGARCRRAAALSRGLCSETASSCRRPAPARRRRRRMAGRPRIRRPFPDRDAAGRLTMWVPAFVCPACQASLADGENAFICVRCDTSFRRDGGVYRFMLPEQADRSRPFLSQYRSRATGRWT